MSRTTLPRLFLLILLTSVFLLSGSAAQHVYAVTVPDYNGANLIDNQVLLNSASMGTGQAGINNIQSFLSSKGGYLASYRPYFDCSSALLGQQSANAYNQAGAPCGQTVSAATIIYYASQVYGLNPQAILATMQKEQSLVTWPSQDDTRLNHAMGYACPDSTGCSSNSTFMYQVDNGTWALRFHYERASGNLNYWYTSTSWTCGSAKNYYAPDLYPGHTMSFYDDNGVAYATYTLANAATSSLYCYTPHAYNNPQGLYGNAAYGTTGMYYSGSYNFDYYFSAWFGSRTGILSQLQDKYNQIASWIGKPTMSGVCNLRNSGCYQLFQNGSIYWTADTGADVVRGGVKTKWLQLGFENGFLGYPTTDELPIAKGVYQLFQGGSIYWTADTGAHEVHGGIKAKWQQLGLEHGSLGYPTTDETPVTGGVNQEFQNGTIYWSASAGAYMFNDNVYTKWVSLGGEAGDPGKPTIDSICTLINDGCYQLFATNRSIYWTADTGAHEVHGGIKAKWQQLGLEHGSLGYPTTDETPVTGGVNQEFQNGTIYWSASAGASVTSN